MIHSLREWEERCHSWADAYLPWCAKHLRKRARILRYLIAGGTAAFVDFGFLYLFTDGFGLHYLTSAILAFIIAFFVSFFLQKFWTFQDYSVEKVHEQAVIYFAVAIFNLAINTGLMYLCVDVWGIWYMAGQFLASGLIAVESFFISRHFVFNKIRNTISPQRTKI